jgi:hypothetical protein
MARGTMHAPKPDDQRRRRNTPAHGERELVRDDEVRGPELADLTGVVNWSPPTVAWFETWRKAPQAQVFEATDWQRLGFLAYLVEDYFGGAADAKLLAEIRQNEERLGATYTDRQRARMRVVAPPDAPEQPGLASVTHLDSARARLSEMDDDD